MNYAHKKPTVDLSCLNEMTLPIPHRSVFVRGCRLGVVHTRSPHSRKLPSAKPSRPDLEILKDDPAEIERAIEKCRREKMLLRHLGREEQ